MIFKKFISTSFSSKMKALLLEMSQPPPAIPRPNVMKLCCVEIVIMKIALFHRLY